MAWADGDFDGNGTVDIRDLSKVLTNSDNTAGLSGVSVKAVPEPSTLALATGVLVGLWSCDLRKQNRPGREGRSTGPAKEPSLTQCPTSLQ
jgi:hypothetical protein